MKLVLNFKHLLTSDMTPLLNQGYRVITDPRSVPVSVQHMGTLSQNINGISAETQGSKLNNDRMHRSCRAKQGQARVSHSSDSYSTTYQKHVHHLIQVLLEFCKRKAAFPGRNLKRNLVPSGIAS
jgi:hypothetical protein